MKISKIVLISALTYCLASCNSEQNTNANSSQKSSEQSIHIENNETTAPTEQTSEQQEIALQQNSDMKGEVEGSEGSDYLEVSISDTNGDFTNIREKPSGKVIMTISTEGTYQTTVCEVSKQWWYICRPIHQYEPDEKDIDIPETGGWIHGSVLVLGTRNYGGQELQLLAEPTKGAKAVFSFEEELTFHPIDKKGEWIKVENKEKKATGWIESKWLCGNAVTNCN